MKRLLIKNREIDELLSNELKGIDISFERHVNKNDKDQYFSYFELNDDDFYIAKEANDNFIAEQKEKEQIIEAENRNKVSFTMFQIVLSSLVNPLVALIMCAINYKYSIIKRILVLLLIPFIVVLLFTRLIYDYIENFNFIQLSVYIFIEIIIVLIAWEFKNTKSRLSNLKVFLLNGLVLFMFVSSILILEFTDYDYFSKYNKLVSNSRINIYYTDDYTIEFIENAQSCINDFDEGMLLIADTIIFTKEGQDNNIIFIVGDYWFKRENISIKVHQELLNQLRDIGLEMYKYNAHLGRLKYWFIQQKKIY